MSKYDKLRELALANFELLLQYWEIDYTRVNDREYDFLNPLREDTNYGACRFNVVKGTGADFASRDFEDSDFSRLGESFTAEDFAGVTKSGGWGFDVIGLCQRLKGEKSYSDAANCLRQTLDQLKNAPKYTKPIEGAILKRKIDNIEQRQKILTSALKIWHKCRDYKGTLAENYFISRGLKDIQEKDIRFHPKIYNSELKIFMPAVLFKVQKAPDSEIQAIHRIYIARDGSRKAILTNPKMALGSIQGAGIWFGEPCNELCIVEGPENALSIRHLGYNFVVSSVNATNFSSLDIPDYVDKIILMPDPDKAGKSNTLKAVEKYKYKTIKLLFPPNIHYNNKLIDWNDVVMGRGEYE